MAVKGGDRMAKVTGTKKGVQSKSKSKGGAKNVVSNQVKVARKAARSKFLKSKTERQAKGTTTTLDRYTDEEAQMELDRTGEEEGENLAEDTFFADESDDEVTE